MKKILCISLRKYFCLSIPGPRQRLVTTQQLQRTRAARCLVASVGTDSRCVDIRLDSDDTCYLWTEFEIIKMTIYETCAISTRLGKFQTPLLLLFST